MPATIEGLYALEGPNTFIEQPAVLIYLRSEEHFRAWFVVRIKEVAQRVGLVIAFLKVQMKELPDDWQIKIEFATPQPSMGCAIAELLVCEYNAKQTQDESWDSEEAIYQLQRQRRQERIPLPLLQLQATCLQHRLPIFQRPDGAWQIGLGGKSVQFEQAELLQNPSFQPNWQELGHIPVAVWIGDEARRRALSLLQALFAEAAPQIQVRDQINHPEARSLFSDQQLERVLFGLEVDTIFTKGLPFGRCDYAALLDVPDPDSSCIDPQMWIWSSVLPLVFAEAPNALCVVNADDERLVELSGFGSGEIVFITTGSAQAEPVIAKHRATGGQALIMRGRAVYHAKGEQEELLGQLASDQPHEQLALLASYLYLHQAGFADLSAALGWE